MAKITAAIPSVGGLAVVLLPLLQQLDLVLNLVASELGWGFATWGCFREVAADFENAWRVEGVAWLKKSHLKRRPYVLPLGLSRCCRPYQCHLWRDRWIKFG